MIFCSLLIVKLGFIISKFDPLDFLTVLFNEILLTIKLSQSEDNEIGNQTIKSVSKFYNFIIFAYWLQ